MASSDAGNPSDNASKEAEKPPIEPIRLPTVEEVRAQEVWNNCAVRGVLSGVMGMPQKALSFLFLFFPLKVSQFIVFFCMLFHFGTLFVSCCRCCLRIV